MLRSLSEGWGELVVNEAGDGYHLRRVRWALEQDCEQPYRFEVFARTSFVEEKTMGKGSLWVFASTPCRMSTCFACQRSRRLFWTARAGTEFDMWPRTFLGTFTLSFEEHLELDMHVEAGNPLRKRPRRAFRELDAKGAFAARCAVFGEYLTDYLKRVRKQISTDFRYLLIAEAHDSEETSEEMRGRPHFHILFHEKIAGALVRGDTEQAMIFGKDGEFEKRWVKTRKGWRPFLFATDEAELRRQWQRGHTKFQLCDSSNSAIYPCKYVTKSAGVRPRASQLYGLLEKQTIQHSRLDEGETNQPEGGSSSTQERPERRRGEQGNSKEVPLSDERKGGPAQPDGSPSVRRSPVD